MAPSTPWSVRYPRTVRRIPPRWGLFKRRLPRHIDSRQTSGVVKKGVTSDTYTMDLQPREFTLLQELMLNAGRVLSREQLEERMYRWGEEVESNAVGVHVHHLLMSAVSGAWVVAASVSYRDAPHEVSEVLDAHAVVRPCPGTD